MGDYRAKPDENYESRIRASFARQSAMVALAAEVVSVKPGEVEIAFPFREEFSQQHGFMHGGIVATVLDSASGYAALTLMPADSEVLTIEFKVNFVRPAQRETFVARAKVVSHGRRIVVSTGTVHGLDKGLEKLIATMTATLIPASADAAGG